MLLRYLNIQSSTLLTSIHHSYVIRYTPKRSYFDKTTYNEDWLPRQTLYHKKRKPRQTQWDDPNIIYPQLIPPIIKPNTHKYYIKSVIEKEETQKAIRSKEYILEDIRPGDIVDITYQETFENNQTVTHRALVLGFRRRNQWSAAIDLAIRFGGMSLRCVYLIHSPRVKKIQLVAKGSGCFRSNLSPGWKNLTKTQLTTPKIKKRVMKSRGRGRGAIKKKAGRKHAGAVKFDDIKTQNVRRLI